MNDSRTTEISGSNGDNDDDGDDEFFGAQDEEDDGDFGDMAKHEIQARHHQLRISGYLEAFDDSKEELLQEGFEAGFLETFELGKSLGLMLGKAATQSKLAPNKSKEETSSQVANQLVHKFFAGDFQANRDPSTVGEDLSRLLEETLACFDKNTEGMKI